MNPPSTRPTSPGYKCESALRNDVPQRKPINPTTRLSEGELCFLHCCVYIYVYMYICIHILAYIILKNINVCIYLTVYCYIYINICMTVYTYIYICIYIYMSMNQYLHVLDNGCFLAMTSSINLTFLRGPCVLDVFIFICLIQWQWDFMGFSGIYIIGFNVSWDIIYAGFYDYFGGVSIFWNHQWEFQDPKLEVLYHISGHILRVYLLT